jgi:two-component system, OmpR family, sensor histidine kinase CreC
MSFSFRIFLGYFVILGFASYLFFSSLIDEVKPAFRQSTEESLVDTANLLAEVIAINLKGQTVIPAHFTDAVAAFKSRSLNAKIWQQTKQSTSLDFYITDSKGIVIYDSAGSFQGKDFGNWNDVYETLRGRYGARSTLSDPNNKYSSVMHVAAPIMSDGQIIGVVSVRKPNLSLRPFILAAQRNLTAKSGVLMMIAILAGMLLSFWLTRSIRQLADYAKAVRIGQDIAPPKVQGRELLQLSLAMSSMKQELDGKQYVEHYIHTLTHQLKSPIASIHGAAELLAEPMDPVHQQRFINNIINESRKMQDIVQRMLDLAAIEHRTVLQNIEQIDLDQLIKQIIDSQSATIQHKSLSLKVSGSPIILLGERFLMGQAITNLLDNAINFSPIESIIEIELRQSGARTQIIISDQGPGIPEFALPQLFDRFYSVPRPEGKTKGTGLGLCFVKEIARLHNGSISLENRSEGGARAILSVQNFVPKAIDSG